MSDSNMLSNSEAGISHGSNQHRPGVLEATTLPPDHPEHLIVTPTLNRWKNNGERAPLPQLIASVQEGLRQDGLSDSSWIMLGDGSSYDGVAKDREDALSQIDMNGGDARVFVLTPENQALVARRIQERTGLRQVIVNALLTDTGYAGQRAKLDIVAGGMVTQSGKAIRLLGLDDDIVIPQDWGRIRPDALPKGLEPRANSQTLIQHEGSDYPEEIFDQVHGNSMVSFFRHLGQRVGTIRQGNPNFRATENMQDTMHGALDIAMSGEPAQFVVNPANEDDMPGAENARIVATSATKSLMPDYRTVRIAEAYLRGEFPEHEVPIRSFPSGPNEGFAFHKSSTNVDSAVLSRLITPETAMWPWWFVSSLDVSLGNPLQTVTGHYRADNEILPVLLEVMRRKPGQPLYMYEAGIDTQAHHLRAKSGYRPGMHEQASASLIGNIAALEAASRLEWDPVTGKARLYQVDADYKAPTDKAYKAFVELRGLAEVCSAKILELRSREDAGLSAQEQVAVRDKIMKFAQIQGSIAGKLGGFDFGRFHDELNKEVKGQLEFYGDVLNAMPAVTDEARRMMAEGKYPIVEFKRQ